jgi:16S rRNA (adenine1518-N6/adenine1519-N6)-dimethyltransferase
MPDKLPPLRDVINAHGLFAKRAFGQHFLLDQNLTRRITRAAGDLNGAIVIEVGPGPGGLTRCILEAGAKQVIAIEKDRRCIAALKDLKPVFLERLNVVEGDALKIDEMKLIPDPCAAPIKIVANLPYNIATTLLFKWLEGEEWPPGIQSYTLLFQKEVANRIVASPGTKAYGRVSVATGWRCDAVRHFDIKPEAFTPPPKVTSTLVTLTPKASPQSGFGPADLKRVTAAAFGQRRKMLRSSLISLGVSTGNLLQDSQIDPTERADQISIDDYCRLASVYCRLSRPMTQSP